MRIKNRQNISWLLVLFLFMIAVYVGCGSQPATESQQSGQLAQKPQTKRLTKEEKLEKEARAALNVERIKIPIDDTLEGAEVSLQRNFYFIFDGSGSMRNPPEGACAKDSKFKTKLQGAKWALKEFMKKVPDDVNLGLYVFDAFGSREVLPLQAHSREAFLKSVDNIMAGGRTPLAEAIGTATEKLIEQYKQQLGYGEYRIIVVTDGIAKQIPDAAVDAAKYGMPIYAIGLCIESDHPLRYYAVSYRAADNFEDLAKGLEDTLAELPFYDATEFEGAKQ